MCITRSILVVVGLSALCAACTTEPGRISFCDTRDGIPYFSQSFTLDLVNSRYVSVDTGSYITVARTARYRGLIDPIPMAIPTIEMARPGRPVRWAHGNYKFVAHATPRADRITVRAVPANEPAVTTQAEGAVYTLLYSYQSGVISLRKEGEFFGSRYVDIYYPCLGEKLDLLQV
jgi:hypothetical protein